MRAFPLGLRARGERSGFCPSALSRAFNAGFGLDLMAKDLTIALDLARETATPVPFAALCLEMWASAAAMLGKGQDHTAMAKLSKSLARHESGGEAAVPKA